MELSDPERFPLLTEAGWHMLRRLREHPHAPRYTFVCGERLSDTGLDQVRSYARALETERRGWRPGELPAWVPGFVARCRQDVPFHRRRSDWTDDFSALPTTNRHDLRREPWAFVPDSQPLDDLVVYTTSGTTGEALRIPSHPEVPSRYLPLMQVALATHGVRLDGGARVSIVMVAAQLRTYTYPSVISFLDFAGFAKINLNPDDWRDPDDRVHFVDDCDPEIYTGDPIALAELARLPLRTRPKALISSATTLLPGMRDALEARFGCPVIDLYSSNESGPIAFSHGQGHEILPHDLYVEVVDEHGRPCPPGVRGEITLTGGMNPFLPLVRYRTGDFAAMDFSGPLPVLVELQGRPPTVFRTAAGRTLNSVDVSTALRDLALPMLHLHQGADGALCFRARCDQAILDQAELRLRALFGPDMALHVELVSETQAWAGKTIQYTSELPAPGAEEHA